MSLFNRRIPTMRDHERFNAAPRKDELLEKVEDKEENVVLEEDISATEEEDLKEEIEEATLEEKALGVIIVYHMTKDGEELDSEILTDLEMGSHVVKSKTFDGYERVGNRQKTLKIREDKPEIEYTFYYQKKE